MTALAVLLLLAADPAPAPPPGRPATPALQDARDYFAYGTYGAAAELAQRLLGGAALERVSDRIEACRILGLSRYFLHDEKAARSAFLQLLSLDPDYQLDPFYVPPPAIAVFEQVRHDYAGILEPLREQKREERREARRETTEKPAASKGGTGAPEPQVRIVHEQIERRNPGLALLPFGIGQLQNGERTLGFTLLGAEALTAAASFVCYDWFQQHRLPDGNFDPSLRGVPETVRAVQIGTGAAFFALWAFGIGDALWRFNPIVVVRTDPDAAAPPPAPAPTPHASLVPLPGGAAAIFSLPLR